MNYKMVGVGILMVLLAGCTAVERSRAVVNEGTISNPSLGFSGFRYEIPEGFNLYSPDDQPEEGWSELQQMAIRIYDLNESYHPSGSETFYESFLIFSGQTAFLLATVTDDQMAAQDSDWLGDEFANGRELFPMYNLSQRERVLIGGSQLAAVEMSGRAYESGGWYYPNPKLNRIEFRYNACRVEGVNRDRYILIGFSLPDYEHILSLQMQEMISGFCF
jgi:hypothetical protein